MDANKKAYVSPALKLAGNAVRDTQGDPVLTPPFEPGTIRYAGNVE